MLATQTKPTASILEHFSCIPDPRVNRRKLHQLKDIFFITLCGAICGADDWVAIAEFGRAKEAWFTEVLGLEHGIPSHDTFSNVFAVIDTTLFAECFSRWASDLGKLSGEDIIAVDGKCMRGSIDRASGKAAIYMVSAWSTQNRVVLGQEKVADKSNEITAIPKLLERLDITGAVLTTDAMGCQTDIVDLVIEKGGDYFLCLKGNQGTLHADVKLFFETESTCPPVGFESFDAEHGRFETRTVRATSDIDWLKQSHPNWTELTSIVSITARRECKDKVSEETRYFITSLDANNPARLGFIGRSHWGVENGLHWALDWAFREDHQRARVGNSAANMSIIRHIALNLAKSEKTAKLGIKNKRLKAGWDENYLLQLLLGARN